MEANFAESVLEPLQNEANLVVMKKWMCLFVVTLVAGGVFWCCFEEEKQTLKLDAQVWHYEEPEYEIKMADMADLDLFFNGLQKIKPESRSIVIHLKDNGKIISPEVGAIDELSEFLLMNGVKSTANGAVIPASAGEIELVVIARKKALSIYRERINESVKELHLEKITYSAGLLDQKFEGCGFKDGIWYYDGELVGVPIWLMVDRAELVKIHAPKNTEMQHFEPLLSALKDSEAKLQFTTLDGDESITIEMLSALDKKAMATMIDAFEKSDLLGVQNQQFKLAGIVDGVLAVNVSDKTFGYVNADGRGMKHFKSFLDQEDVNLAMLGISEQTSLNQFIKGMKAYQASGVKTLISVNNRKAALAFPQEPQTENQQAEKYIPQAEDLPVSFRMPERLRILEKESIGLPYGMIRAAMKTLIISLDKNGDLRLWNEEVISLSKFKILVKVGVETVGNYDEMSAIFNVHTEADPRAFMAVLNVLKKHNITEIVFPDKNVIHSQGGFEEEVDGFPSLLVKPEVKQIKVVINILNEGKLTGIHWSEEIKNIEAYLKIQVAKYKELKLKGIVVMHLRGTEENLFKYHHRIARAAANAGVTRVVFSAYPAPEKKR